MKLRITLFLALATVVPHTVLADQPDAEGNVIVARESGTVRLPLAEYQRLVRDAKAPEQTNKPPVEASYAAAEPLDEPLLAEEPSIPSA